jgi:hypothetical protein
LSGRGQTGALPFRNSYAIVAPKLAFPAVAKRYPNQRARYPLDGRFVLPARHRSDTKAKKEKNEAVDEIDNQIVFSGENFNAQTLLRMRDRFIPLSKT